MCLEIYFYRYDYQKYVLGAFGGHMPSLNVESESLRREIKDILQFWIKKSVNLGFRLDAIYYNKVTAKNHDGIPYCKFIRDTVNMLNEPIEYSNTLGNVFDFYNSFNIINQIKNDKPIKIENPYKRNTLFSCNHDTARLYTMLNNNISKVKQVLETMILKTDSDVIIYYGTEGNWYGDVINGNDLYVRSKMNEEHMQGLLCGKYNSLVHYIKDLIAQAK